MRRQGAVSARDVRCDLRRNKLTSLMLAPAAGWVPAVPSALACGKWAARVSSGLGLAHVSTSPHTSSMDHLPDSWMS